MHLLSSRDEVPENEELNGRRTDRAFPELDGRKEGEEEYEHDKKTYEKNV